MTQSSKVPLLMLDAIPSGYYAVRPDAVTPYTFVRISRPTLGRWKGHVKVQTIHAEDLVDRWVWNPGNPDPRTNVRTLSFTRFKGEQSIEDLILLVIVGHREAGIAYAREIRRCCRCNTRLTDERSRWYGFGPECEQSLEGMKDEIDDENGGTYEYLKSIGEVNI
jgi:hypothetical protein